MFCFYLDSVPTSLSLSCIFFRKKKICLQPLPKQVGSCRLPKRWTSLQGDKVSWSSPLLCSLSGSFWTCTPGHLHIYSKKTLCGTAVINQLTLYGPPSLSLTSLTKMGSLLCCDWCAESFSGVTGCCPWGGRRWQTNDSWSNWLLSSYGFPATCWCSRGLISLHCTHTGVWTRSWTHLVCDKQKQSKV